MKQFLILLALAIFGAFGLFKVIIWLQEERRAEQLADPVAPCVLLASIKTDTYKPYGKVANRRHYYLNQYRCGDKLKTLVE